MIRHLRKTGRVLPVTLGCAALLVALGSYAAQAQTAKPNPEQQLNQLRQLVAGLERRIVELEKVKPGGVIKQDDASTSQARLDKLEQRLGSLERSRPSGPGVTTIGTTVTAPFSVVDRAGLPLMRVGEAESGAGGLSRGLYILGNSGKPVAHIGVTVEGAGRVYATTATATRPDLQMFASPDGPKFILHNGGKLSTEINKDGISYYNSSEKAVLNITSKDQKGRLEILDANGSITVEAGTLKNNKGYVVASPWRVSPDVRGDPSVLKGGGK
jgi:hypothetical protein